MWGCAILVPGEKPQIGAFEAIARYDLTSGKKIVHQFPAGSTVCEPLFVAEPHGKSEQDGFIFSFVHRQGEPGGSYVILDARHLSGKPLATVHLPGEFRLVSMVRGFLPDRSESTS